MRWVVLGLGISGRGAVQLLRKFDREVIALDSSNKKFERKSRKLCTGSDREPVDYSDVCCLIISPGILPTHPQVQKAKDAGVEVIGEAELGLRFLNNRCVAITGTNGKTTAVQLTAHALTSANIPAKAIGNVGASICEYLTAPIEGEILVMELSSFQLETLQSQKIEMGLILNITPDHLDRYANMQEYAFAKLRLQECVKSKELWVSQSVFDQYQQQFQESPKIFDVPNPKLATIKNPQMIPLENLYAAFQVCQHFGVSFDAFERSIPTFQKSPHRLEFVLEHQSVRFYNDSKATNVEAVCSAIKSTTGRLVLIAGGVDKQSSYDAWVEAFEGRVKQVFVMGPASDRITQVLQGKFPIEKVCSLKEAVMKACQCAQKHDTVLLSPGCSSFDAFNNFEERGNVFKQLVHEFTGGKSK